MKPSDAGGVAPPRMDNSAGLHTNSTRPGQCVTHQSDQTAFSGLDWQAPEAELAPPSRFPPDTPLSTE